MVKRAASRYRPRSSYKKTKTASSSRINTYQNSTDNIYVRRRPNRRRARRARKFNSRVMRVVTNNLTDQNYRRYSTGTSTSLSGQQNIFSFSLNAIDGTSSNNNDLLVINNNLTPSDSRDGKFVLRSSMLDMTIRASDDNDTVTYVDIYYVVARKDVPTADADSISDDFEDSMTIQSGSINQTLLYGVTPFQASRFCQNWLITRVQRSQLSPGQVISSTQLNTRLRNLSRSTVQTGNFAARGLTRGLLIVHAGGPSSSTGAPVASTLTFNTTRSYCCNVLEDNFGAFVSI